MRENSQSIYSHVQSLSRGLALLRSINLSPKGWMSIAELCSVTSLHRTTVRRLLETLQAEGYVRYSVADNSYCLSQKVRELSDGFTDDAWISEVVNPVLGELLKQVVWPSDLCTLDGDAMVVRETTHRFSSLSFSGAMIRQRMPILFTAAGRAYLAFCHDEVREQLMSLLAMGDNQQATFARDRALVNRMLDKVRCAGFATNEGDWLQQPMIAALAMPVFYADRVLGSINVVFLKKAMSLSSAEKSLLPSLKKAVLKIEARLRERGFDDKINQTHINE